MNDILDLIDGAIEELCACGCGARLAADGPSAWFATETCQGRWTSRQERVGAPTAAPGIVTSVSPQMVASGRSIFEDLIALRDRIRQDPYDHPLPARIELDELARDALRRHTVYQTRPPWAASVDSAFGIPIRIDSSLPHGGWRVLDRNGNVMREGTVTA